VKAEVLFEHDRTAPREWGEMLAVIAPPSNYLTSLHIRWEPGDRWDPIQRWMIWQLRPPQFVRKDVLAELRGPDPRSKGHYCAPGYCLCNMKTNTWRGGAAGLIDREQWKLYRETGCYGTRWWCVQGHNGGHRHRLDETESRTSLLFGGKSDTPVPGELPYADFDYRTFHKVAEMDRVRAWKMVIRYCDRNHDQMDAEEFEAKKEAQTLLWGWLSSQTSRSLDSISRKDWAEFREAVPRGVGQKDTTNYEQIQQEFIENPTS
jgi:hypothetical protein